MKKVFKGLLTGSVVAASLAASGVANAAGVTFLIGSDVMSFHGDASFINPVVDQMANFGTKKLLYLTDSVAGINYTNGNVTIDFKPYSFVDTGADLSPYSGVYADSPGTCCSDPGPSMAAGGAPVLSTFVAGGGSLGVGDYMGHTFWDSILGFTGLPGVTTPGGFGITCLDPGVSTPGGLAFGFAASYSEGCFTHQTYDPAFWASKGYFALQYDGSGETAEHWVTMATGFTDPSIPEPSSILLAALGLLSLGAVRRAPRS